MTFDRSKLFSTKALTERTLTACGQTFTVYVRRLPAVDLRKFYAEVFSNEIDVRARGGFEALSKAIRNEDGSPFATLEEYNKMDTNALKALIVVFKEINEQTADPELGND